MSKNIIDANGIQIETYADILNDIINGTSTLAGLKQIYGSDINTDQNTPDGQLINIFALAKQDLENLIVQDYTSKDPDQAVGVALDGVSQLCGIFRKGGIYTQGAVAITVAQTVTLDGIDTNPSSPFTIADATGNQFQLLTTATLSAGTTSHNFQALNIGYIQVLANTLTIPISIVLGVVSVTNPTVPYQVGSDQETDAQMRLRRQRSVALPSQGVLGGLRAGLLSISGVIGVYVGENVTSSTNGDGVPAHSVWCVVDGGSDADVADMIYRYVSAGCGMYGSTTVPITQVDGSTFNVSFDRPVDLALHIKFNMTDLLGGSLDNDAVKAYLISAYQLELNEMADITTVASLMKEYDDNILIYNCQVSSNGSSWYNSVACPHKYNKFTLSTVNITIL